MKGQFIAHVRKSDGKPQILWEHLKEVSELAGRFAGTIGLKECGELTGLLHDLGKASEEFQNYILSAEGRINPDADGYIDSKAQKGKIDHSTAGAQIVFKTLSKDGGSGINAAQVLSLCIASHHSGLIDCLLPSGEADFNRRINKSEEKTHVNEAPSHFDYGEKEELSGLFSNEMLVKKTIEKIRSLKEIGDQQDTAMFKYGLLARFLFSCLIDADRLSTADFEFPRNAKIRNHGKYDSWDVLVKRLDTKLKEFENKADKNEVDDLRNEVSQQCFAFATKPKGIYQLTVPTGGGKTLASLRFALNHANYHKMHRVFYIIPFTSIIDQNADQVREILEEKDQAGKCLGDVVLEHHSNLTPEEETKRQNLLSENWDAPIVFTTQVQFLEALFGSGTRGARRMHQLANSVIIFDEVQTIPVRCVHMFNVALRFLVNNCGASAVLCTATQPVLDQESWLKKGMDKDYAHRFLSISSEQKIIQNERELFTRLNRVDVFDKRREYEGWSEDEIADLTEKELQDMGSVLVIVNKKESARSLYQKLKERKLPFLYHLSTNMCPAHRLNVLNAVRGRLEGEQPATCVSTQLIEAGIDIDFGTVIRYLAGLDSITQAAGRCNRNGKRKIGNVYIINPQNESLDKLEDIKIGARDAERVLREYKKTPEAFERNVIGLKAMEQFYTYYFYNRRRVMSYPVASNNREIGREDNLFNLLSLNSSSVHRYQEENHGALPSFPLKQSFKSAAKAFHAIDTPTHGVVVPYGKEGDDIVNQLCETEMLEKQYDLLKRAQRFSVNLYPYEFKEMGDAVQEVQKESGIYYMDYQYYSNEFGWSNEIVTEMKNLNF